jgi:uncharacterized damage-inducible protein DinB
MALRIPHTAGEKESLKIALDRHRDAVVWKLEGLDDDELRQAMLPTGNTLLGLVKHLATWEYIWICRTFGEPSPHLPFDDGDEDGDVRVEAHESTADILEFYRRARAAEARTPATRRRPCRRRRVGPEPSAAAPA